jgi:hypothetical protein
LRIRPVAEGFTRIEVQFHLASAAVDRLDLVASVVELDLLDTGEAFRDEALVHLGHGEHAGRGAGRDIVAGQGGRPEDRGAGDAGRNGDDGQEAGCTHGDDSFDGWTAVPFEPCEHSRRRRLNDG